MANYVNITQQEIEEFLLPQGFQKMELPNVKELVYGKRIDQDGLPLCLRVFTGINPDGNSRTVGEDAMRCYLIWKREDGDTRIIASSKRVHRVKGWRNNLDERIATLKPAPIKCKHDGAPMVARKGTFGEFYGCANFPECRHTEKKER